MKYLILLLAMNCAAMTDADRTRLQFDANTVRKGANQAAYQAATNSPVKLARVDYSELSHFPAAMTLAVLPVDPNDCGACNTNPTVQYVAPDPHYTRLQWLQPGRCTGWNIWESTNYTLPSSNWWLNTMVWSSGTSNSVRRATIFSTNNPSYLRVSAY